MVSNATPTLCFRSTALYNAELWLYDKKRCRETTLKINGCHPYRLLAVPLKRRKGEKHSLDDPQIIRKTFRRQMQSSKFMKKLLSAWSSYVDGIEADAAEHKISAIGNT